VVQVQLGRTKNQAFHRVRFKNAQLESIAFDLLEKLCVANERDFYGLHKTGALVARRKRGQQLEIVDDRKWRGKRADKILFAECVNPILDADAGIILAQRGCRNANMPHAAMSGCRRSRQASMSLWIACSANNTSPSRHHATRRQAW